MIHLKNYQYYTIDQNSCNSISMQSAEALVYVPRTIMMMIKEGGQDPHKNTQRLTLDAQCVPIP